MKLTHRCFYVWRRNLTVYRTYIKPSIVSNIGEPLLYLLAMGYGVGHFIPEMEEMSYSDFIAPGLVIAGVMYSSVFECTFGSYTRMTAQKTFDSILATPVSIADLVAGEILWGMTKALISGVIVVGVMALLGIYSPGLSFLGIVAVMGVSGVLFSALALAFSAKAPDYSFFNYFFTLLITPMFFLSGVFFPLDRFPDALKAMALLLPTTHAVSLTRSLFYGTDGRSVTSFLILVAMAAALWYLAYRLVKKRVVK